MRLVVVAVCVADIVGVLLLAPLLSGWWLRVGDVECVVIDVGVVDDVVVLVVGCACVRVGAVDIVIVDVVDVVGGVVVCIL